MSTGTNKTLEKQAVCFRVAADELILDLARRVFCQRKHQNMSLALSARQIERAED